MLVNVANPRPQKRLHLLPAIVAALHAQGQRAALVLAGEPSHGNEIAEAEITRFEAEARACGMEQWVHHIGPLHDAALANLLAGADVFVSTSEFEGLSLAQLEALSAGLPVVASDVAGAREVPGIRLVPVDASSEDYASAILAEAGFTRTSTTRLPADFTVAASTWRYRWLLRAASGIALRAGRKRSGLVLITNNFAVGGAQSSAARLLHHLHQFGHHVRAVVLQERKSDPTPGLLRVRASGLPVAILPTPDVVEPDVALHGWLDEMASHPPHAVLFWNAIPEYKLLIADALPDVPVWEVSPGEMLHDSLQRWFAKPRPGLPLRTTLDYGAMLAGFIVKQHAEIEQARAAFGKQVHCIANGVPVPAQCPPSRARGNTIIFGTAARLSPHKRIEDLLDAFRMLVTGDIKAELHIAGDVDGELEDYAANLRASAHDLPVRWLGNVERIDAFHREIDIFVMISEPAGCPNAIIEAMASGLPVIATAIGGAVDLIEDGRSGVLVPPREAVCLAHAMIALASDAALCIRLGHAAWDRARACFSVERMAADYARVCLAEETTPRSTGRAEPSAPEIVPSA